VIACGATRVNDEMFMVAARTLAGLVQDSDLARGCIFPPLNRIRDISAAIATNVALIAYHQGVAAVPRPHNLAAFIAASMYQPYY
jgi:malate dehydrogenase (oxaloacetate-decarboxylating)(NADP+)